MAYERQGAGPIDYHQCRYGHSKLLFRGPKRNTKSKFCAFVGSSETYGKYVETPFVDLLQDALGQTCVNFGAVNGGVDAFANDPSILDICNRAQKTVVQIMGAHNMSNRFYSVHPRRNDRFVKSSALMETAFREVDFTEFAFTRHLLSTIEVVAPDKFSALVTELQEAWVARMSRYLQEIKSPKVLLWIGSQEPADIWAGPGLGPDPLFVTRGMIDRVSDYVSDFVEVALPTDLITDHLDDMLYPPLEIDAAREMLSPAAHTYIANRLCPVL